MIYNFIFDVKMYIIPAFRFQKEYKNIKTKTIRLESEADINNLNSIGHDLLRQAKRAIEDNKIESMIIHSLIDVGNGDLIGMSDKFEKTTIIRFLTKNWILTIDKKIYLRSTQIPRA